MAVVDRETVSAVPWGAGCVAWPLAEGAELSVKLEEMPPSTAEVRHRHVHARQVFFVLGGTLDMEVAGVLHEIGAEQAIEIAPGTPHQARNSGLEPVRFLVISSPTTAGDREETPP